MSLFSGLTMKTARIVSGRSWSSLVPGSIIPYMVLMDRSLSPMMGNLTSISFSQWATTSLSHSLWDLTGSTERVATRQSMAESSSYFRARRPISVVQTGVKSAGWEKRIAHLPFFHSWKLSMGPWVVSAEKSGTMFPSRKLPSMEPSGYKLMYIFVPDSIVSMVLLSVESEALAVEPYARTQGFVGDDDDDGLLVATPAREGSNANDLLPRRKKNDDDDDDDDNDRAPRLDPKRRRATDEKSMMEMD
mmetsp:Transcript_17732/g.37052  ORF Transcript_17732/g.37052 Transcript_17732/m.37052 type:complete len:247 (-) Transcript_17732:199-939(-)